MFHHDLSRNLNILWLPESKIAVKHWGFLICIIFPFIILHSFFPPVKMGQKKTKSLQWQNASWRLEKSPSVQRPSLLAEGKWRSFADWVFVAGMFSLPLPRFSWLDQSRNRRKGAHINWPCHPKWLWHFQECSPRSSSSFLAAFTLSHKRFLQQWTNKETNKSCGKTSFNSHSALQHFYSHHCLLLTNK